MDFDTSAIREWHGEYVDRLSRSYAGSRADSMAVQLLLAKATKRFGELFVNLSQHLDADSMRQQEQLLVPVPIKKGRAPSGSGSSGQAYSWPSGARQKCRRSSYFVSRLWR